MKILFSGLPEQIVSQHLARFLPEHELLYCGRNETLHYIENVDILVTLGSHVNEALMQQGTFRFIQQFGVGLEKIDIPAASRNGIWVARAPGTETGNAESVAELAIMQMLMLSRRYHESLRQFRAKRTGSPPGWLMAGRKACIVGLGGIGRALAIRLKALQMNVTGVHEYPERGIPEGVNKLFSLSNLKEAVRDADYTILCLNYTSERKHFMDKPEIEAMKQGSYLINIARGGILNEHALLEALENQHLAGAGLDVFWEEPVDPKHPVFRQNVIATPHIGGVTDACLEGTTRLVADNIKRFARGEKPLFTVNEPVKNK